MTVFWGEPSGLIVATLQKCLPSQCFLRLRSSSSAIGSLLSVGGRVRRNARRRRSSSRAHLELHDGLRDDRGARAARCATPTTCPTAGWRRRSTSRCAWRSRCCSRARPASARPRRRRRSPARCPARLIRLQCYEGLDVAHAVYEWNYSRQLLHIRAAQEGTVSEEELFGPEFLIRRPLLEAIESDEPVVLLIDEIDRADEEFEAFLLEVLSDFQITIPEIGTITAARRPSVILTSNRTRELHDALKRRCLFHWIGHPSLEREIEIVLLRVPGIPERLAAQAARFVRGLRGLDLAKPPGVAETIDWAHALAALGRAGARRRDRRADARLGAEVPRGPRDGPRRRARHAGRGGARCRVAPSSGRWSPSAACSARPGWRSGPGASPTRCTGSTPSTSRAATTSTGRCGRRSSRASTTSTPSTAPSPRGSCARPELAPPRTPQVERVRGVAGRARETSRGEAGGGRGGRRARDRLERPRSCSGGRTSRS